MPREEPNLADVDVVSSVAGIPADEWAALEGDACPLWARSVFELIEHHDIGVDGFSYVVVRRLGRIVAVLPVFWFLGFPLDEALGEMWRRPAQRLRRRVPRFGRISMLVCGHPLAEGRMLGGALESAETERVMEALGELAAARNLTWTVFKDFSSASLLKRLPQTCRRPFFPAPALPDAMLDLPEDLDAHIATLRPKARRNARSKLRRFARAPELKLEVMTEWSAHVPKAVALYEQVFARADARFERLSPAFFTALCESELDSPLIACWDGDRMVGCLVCLISGVHCVSFRIGLDYEVARRHDLWFILQYEAIRLATSRGCQDLNLMQSTYPAKRELGSRLNAPAHHLSHRSAALSALMGGGLARMLAASVEASLQEGPSG
jgi:hypothetical protein